MLLDVEIREQVGIITLRNEKKANCLSLELAEDLVATFNTFKEKKIPVVIIRSNENCKVWSAGHDVKELPLKRRDPLGYNDSLEMLLRAVDEYPWPVIAMVHGSVWGGACELVLTCDLIIGDETSSFAMTPVKLSMPYNIGGILHFVNRLPLNIAKEMFFTADPVPAERALNFGILNHLVSSDKLFEFTFNMAKTITTRSQLAVRAIKQQIQALSKSYPLSPVTFELIQGIRRDVYDSADYEEAITSFLEKRTPIFKGK